MFVLCNTLCAYGRAKQAYAYCKRYMFFSSEVCSRAMARIPHTICMLKVLNLLAKPSGVGMESRGIGIGSYFPKFVPSQ